MARPAVRTMTERLRLLFIPTPGRFGFAARLAAIDTTALTAELRVDAAMLSDSVARRIFELDELRNRRTDEVDAFDAFEG